MVYDCGRKERKGRKIEGMLDGVGFWKERKEREEDGRNAGLCRVVVMGEGWGEDKDELSGGGGGGGGEQVKTSLNT